MARLMHASLTGNVFFVVMPADASAVTWYLVSTAVPWAPVLALAVARRRAGWGHGQGAPDVPAPAPSR